MNTFSKLLLLTGIFASILGSMFIWGFLNTDQAKLIACNVGQGDAILIQSSKGSQMLVDGGPGASVLDCLSKHLPFWDKKLEMVVNTHPQKDHLAGLVFTLERYNAGLLIQSGLKAQSGVFNRLEEILNAQNQKTYSPQAGDKFVLDDLDIEVLWPSLEMKLLWQSAPPKDLNESSIVLRVTPKNSSSCIYLTGDAPLQILEKIIDKKCDILKVAHHGSKTGTSEQLMEQAGPKLALIQSGAGNSYGHPNKETLDILGSFGVNILRNDILGNVELTLKDGQWLYSSN